MTDKYKNIVDNLIRWGMSSDKLFAALVIGSQARDNHAADEYSDMDIVLIVDSPSYFIESDKWLNEIGVFHVSFVENTMDGLKERRVLFSDVLDVDFIFRPINTIEKISTDEVSLILSYGYSILIDKIGLQEKLTRRDTTKQALNLPTEQDFINIVNDFWYHSIWTMKKLKRGELWTAKFCVDSYMKWKLLSIIEYNAHTTHGYEYNTWHSGRFLEEWAESWIVEKLALCFSRYDEESIKAALQSTMDLFRVVAVEVAEKLNFQYPKAADEYTTAWVTSSL